MANGSFTCIVVWLELKQFLSICLQYLYGFHCLVLKRVNYVRDLYFQITGTLRTLRFRCSISQHHNLVTSVSQHDKLTHAFMSVLVQFIHIP